MVDTRGMYLGEVIGTVVAERKAPGLRGIKLMLVQPLDEDRKPHGSKEVAVDTVQAGTGDLFQSLEPAAHLLTANRVSAPQGRDRFPEHLKQGSNPMHRQCVLRWLIQSGNADQDAFLV